MKIIFLPAFIILFFLNIGFAQDSHYWTNQYGTDAQLLGGLVVGSVNDLSRFHRLAQIYFILF